MRKIDDEAIRRHAESRFRSEYDYALFEYYRSAKVIWLLERAGVPIKGRCLDAGCGGGGMPVSFGEELEQVVGIDLARRFHDAGARLARETGADNVLFAQADGLDLPFQDASFDLVLSHAVIEHVADAVRYLTECARVLKPDGWMYLSTAPYLSFAGAHLPRLKIPLPLHLVVGRRLAFGTFVFLARHAAWTLREKEDENTFIKDALADRQKQDDLLEKVRVRRLRGQFAEAGLGIVHEDLTLTGTFKGLPWGLPDVIRSSPVTQDVATSVMQYVLRRT